VLSMRELVSNSFSSLSVTRRRAALGVLPHSPEPFSALKIGQFVELGHRQAENLSGVRGLR
jgi:hypothetical protein